MPAQPSRTWRWQFGPTRLRAIATGWITQYPLPDSDFVTCTDSGFSVLVDADGVTGTDNGTVGTADLDVSGKAVDLELTAWPSSFDQEFGGETQYWTGPLSSADASQPGSDGPNPVVFVMTDTDASGPETDAGPGASGTIEQIDVYTFQPPFRFQGGYYHLVLDIPAVHPHVEHDGVRQLALWRGERPDGTAYRLYAAFAAGQIHFLSAQDTGACVMEEGEVASLQVTVHIAAALAVGLEVS